MTVQTAPAALPAKEAIAHFKAKKLVSAFDYRDIWLYEHAVQFAVAKMMDQDLLAETHAALTDALQNGTDFNAFKQRLKPYLMSRGWWGEQQVVDPVSGELTKAKLGSTRRLRTIYHTNLHTAFAAGQWQRIQTTKKALPFLQYNPSVAAEPREAHRKWYGLVRPADDPIWQSIMPPNDYGCLCWVRQLTRSQAVRAGISDPVELEYQEYVNKRTGEVMQVPANIAPGFAHPHGDRLGAVQNLYQEKLKSYPHIKDKPAALAAFQSALNRYMLKLVKRPGFEGREPSLSIGNIAPLQLPDAFSAQGQVYLHAGTGKALNNTPLGKGGSKELIEHNGKPWFVIEYGQYGTSFVLMRDIEAVVTQYTGKELGDLSTQRAGRAAIKRKLQSWRDQTFNNRDLAEPMIITGKSISKIQDAEKLWLQQYIAASKLTELMSNAKLLSVHPDYAHQNNTVDRIYRFYAPIEIADERYAVKLTVRGYVDRNTIHAIDALEIEKAPDTVTHGRTKVRTEHPHQALTQNISDLYLRIKD